MAVMFLQDQDEIGFFFMNEEVILEDITNNIHEKAQ
jgi:hypothetical protein